MNQNSNQKRYIIDKGGLYVLCAGTLWGTTGVFSHLFRAYNLTPMMMAILRVMAAIICLTPIMIAQGKKSLLSSKRNYFVAFIQGLCSQTFFNICYFSAISRLSMSSAVVLLYTSPIYVAILSRILFKERITKKKLMALLIVIVGVTLTATGGSFDLESLSVFGIVMGLGAGFFYATLTITGRFLGESESPLSITYYSMVFGFIGLLFFQKPADYMAIQPDLKLVLIILLSGAISAFPYVAFYHGLSIIREASMAPIFSAVENISATLLGFFLFAEPVGIYRVVGIILVLISIALINRGE